MVTLSIITRNIIDAQNGLRGVEHDLSSTEHLLNQADHELTILERTIENEWLKFFELIKHGVGDKSDQMTRMAIEAYNISIR